MKRLSACSALALLIVGTSFLSSLRAQGAQPPKVAQSDDVSQALAAYEERKLEHCRKEIEEMKKELHELIDLRFKIATSLSDYRCKLETAASAGAAKHTEGDDAKQKHNETQARELDQLHSQLQSEIDGQHKLIAQLGTQLQTLKQQIEQAQHGEKGDLRKAPLAAQTPGQTKPSSAPVAAKSSAPVAAKLHKASDVDTP